MGALYVRKGVYLQEGGYVNYVTYSFGVSIAVRDEWC